MVDQLVLATVAGSQAGRLTKQLVESGFYVTQVDSKGGILYDTTVSLLIGLDHDGLDTLLEDLRACCHTRHQYVPAQVEASMPELQPMMIETEVGGATVYVLDVERFEQF